MLSGTSPGDELIFKIAGKRFKVAWAGEGWLRQILMILDNYKERPDIMVARKMSDGARAVLDKEGIGWIDEFGAAQISIDTIIVSKTGNQKPLASPKIHWTRAVVAVAEAVLCSGKVTLSAVKEATGLSTGSCTNALRVLTKLGFLKGDKERGPAAARRLVNFEGLLDAYSNASKEVLPQEEMVVGILWQDPVKEILKIGKEWSSHDVEWAVSGALASEMLAPILTSFGKGVVYVKAKTMAELEFVASLAGLKAIEGGRLILKPISTPTTIRLSSVVNEINVAPWPRVYIDLRQSGVRGEEAAEHLLEVVHGK